MKKRWKIGLDVLLLLLMVTLYDKHFISLFYHELAGVLLMVLLAVHIGINFKMVRAMGKNAGRLPLSLKVNLAVDGLLFLCMAWIGLSGVMISHVLFQGIATNAMVFKLGHMFAAGLSVLLLGIHIGLHLCRRQFPKVGTLLVTAVLFCGGGYGMLHSDVARWLSMPLTAAAEQESGHRDVPLEGRQEKTEREETDPPKEAAAAPERGGGKGERPMEGQGKGNQTMTLAERGESGLQFLCMILSCAAATYWIAKPKKKRETEAEETQKEKSGD